jgi:hypothetical protein
MTKRRTRRELSPEESLSVIEKYLDPFLNFKNHHKAVLQKNTYAFTVNFISLDFLITLMEDDLVRNVYFNAAAAPAGEHVDGISMRYKVYVHYKGILE